LTLLIDAAPLVALADPDEPRRERILEILTEEPEALVIPAPTTAEIDYLLGQRFGHAARRAFLRDLAAGRFVVAGLDREDYATIVGSKPATPTFSSDWLTARSSCSPIGIEASASSALTSGTSEPSRRCVEKHSPSSQPTPETTTTASCSPSAFETGSHLAGGS
jgi:hypothetical protein